MNAPQPSNLGGILLLAVTPERAAELTGTSRTRIFRAIKDKEITAHKDGERTTLIEASELARWVRSMPTRGRVPDMATA
jgi:excisionase family DNA binding protein